MKKISIFVEGQTERIFVEYLLRAYFTSTELFTLTCKKVGEGLSIIRGVGVENDAKFYFLIFESGNDERAVGDLLERAEEMLCRDSFSFLFALRDLYPKPFAHKKELINKTKKLFAQYPFANRLKLILAVDEIESWFLAEYNVFCKIDSLLTPQYIKEQTRFDLIADDPESYRKPSSIINRIFKLVNQRYRKTEADTYKIVSRLNFDFLYLETTGKIESFFYFLKCINDSVV